MSELADARRIELALARIHEVRQRLALLDLPIVAAIDMRCSLPAAMQELHALLPAERAKVWAEKWERCG